LWDRVYIQAKLDLFVLPHIARMTGMYQCTQPLLENGFPELFFAWPVLEPYMILLISAS
jgi:hypothetical protein